MIELTWIPGALQAVGWLYVGLVVMVLAFALIKPKTVRRKALWTLGVLGLFVFWPGSRFIESHREQQAKQQVDERHS